MDDKARQLLSQYHVIQSRFKAMKKPIWSTSREQQSAWHKAKHEVALAALAFADHVAENIYGDES